MIRLNYVITCPTCLVPFMLPCPMCLVSLHASMPQLHCAQRAFLSYVLSSFSYLIPYVFPNLTCYMPYKLLCLTYSLSYVPLCLMLYALSCLMAPALRASSTNPTFCTLVFPCLLWLSKIYFLLVRIFGKFTTVKIEICM